MCRKNKTKTEKGVALLIAVILVSVMLFAALALGAVSVAELKIANSSKASNVAYQIADAGMEEALKVILKDNPGTGIKISDLAADLSSGCNGEDGSYVEIEKDFPINASDPSDNGKYILILNKKNGNLACDNDISKIVDIKSQGIYKQNTRIIETTLNPTP